MPSQKKVSCCHQTQNNNQLKLCFTFSFQLCFGKPGDVPVLVPIFDPEFSFCFAVESSSSVRAITCNLKTLAQLLNHKFRQLNGEHMITKA